MIDFLKLIFFGVTKSVKLEMYNPKNNEKKMMPVGFNLNYLVLSGFFGLPLFSKRLWFWGCYMFALTTVQFGSYYFRFTKLLSATTQAEYERYAQSNVYEQIAGFLLLIFSILLAIKGNEMGVKNLLKKGWHFSNPELTEVKSAAQKWHISKHYLKPVKDKETL